MIITHTFIHNYSRTLTDTFKYLGGFPREVEKESDLVSRRILAVLNGSDAPLETKEIERSLEKQLDEQKEESLKHSSVTRVKVLYRLNLLRGDGLIKGKAVGSGKGTWIWWKKGVFHEE